MRYDKIPAIRAELAKGFIGDEMLIERILIAVLCEGNILLEDIPGVGKTTLAKTLARVVSCDFGRIQFTPDTMPSDVTGVTVYRMETGEFEYRPGAAAHQIVLADEINRTSPKTQSALLEAMEEHQVTVDGTVHPLPSPFFVIATQNPIEFAGTYPLPEAQMDRFLMRLSIGYPDSAAAARIAEIYLGGLAAEKPEAVITAQELVAMQEEVRTVEVHQDLVRYAIRIIESTRDTDLFRLGASPRAMTHLLGAARAKAYLSGREYVIPDDIRDLAAPVLAHRLILQPELRMKKTSVAEVLAGCLAKVAVPV